MKKLISVRVVVSLLLSAVLFCMPAGAFLADRGNAAEVYAQEETEKAKGEESKEQESTGSTGVSSGDSAETDADESGGTGTEADAEESGGTENGTEEGSEGATQPEIPPECICKEKCSLYAYDTDCEVCRADYKACAYVTPTVKITISTPDGWHYDTTKVFVSVEDIKKSGNFAIWQVQAKIAENGNWTDITEDMYVEISENCTVYVQVTDQNGKTYEKNRYMKCFDFTKPTLNAAVSDGLLSVQAQDTDSGIKAVYVNGYEFTDLTNGVLNIRLQQFDAGYEYFTIQAMDNAGNMSEVYKTANPYYTDSETADSNESSPAEQLPVNAEATKPGSATAEVTEHTKIDSDGNTTSQSSMAEQKKQAMEEAADSEKADGEPSEQGREFYTIQTANEKVFYLIIDRNGEEEMVYFLTEISENDLLNVTSDNSETLPKNSAALESAIPTTEGALSNHNGENAQPEDRTDTEGENNKDTEDAGEMEQTEETPVETENPMVLYLIFGVLAVAAIGAGYYWKVAKKNNEQFLDEDDDEDEEEILEDDEEESDSEDDFFAEDEESEDE